MTIKPIETHYKGYRFRSRLEARWAVFFDALGLRWEYEPEGYDLGSVGWYLPDFRVQYPGRAPDEAHARWIEVKGSKPSQDFLRHMEFARNVADLTVVCGLPECKAYTCYTFLDSEDDVRIVDALLWSTKGRMWFAPSDNDVAYYLSNEPLYITAINAARAARFEHGENGK
jgi:hypothetical protein